MRRHGWRVRAAPTALGYLAQARRDGEQSDAQVPWGSGATEVEALEALAEMLPPFHRAR